MTDKVSTGLYVVAVVEIIAAALLLLFMPRRSAIVSRVAPILRDATS